MIGCRLGGHGGDGAYADDAVKLQPPILHLRRPTFRVGRAHLLLQLGVAPTTPSIMNSSDHQPNSSEITTGQRAAADDCAAPSLGTMHVADLAHSTRAPVPWWRYRRSRGTCLNMCHEK